MTKNRTLETVSRSSQSSSRKRRRTVLISLVAGAAVLIPGAAYAADAITTAIGGSEVTESGVYRFGGADRYGTGVEISKASFTSAQTVYLATGANFPDALAAGPAAAKQSAPLLLTATDSLPGSVADEIKRLGAKRVILLGSEGAISAQVASQVSALGVQVERQGGADRYTTAQKIVSSAFAGYSGPVYVASGTNFPDALSGASVAAMDGAPVVLVNPGAAPQATLDLVRGLNPTSYVVLGGPNAVSDAAVDQLRAVKSAPVSRVQGATRYETSALVSATKSKPGATVFIATGTKFPDALAGVAAAAVNNAPILLAEQRPNGGCLPQAVADEFDRISPSSVVYLGGTSTISTDAIQFVCK